MDINKTKLIREWGSSDQNIMNQAIHDDAGKPKKMPSPFDNKLRSAAEDAVDFYWDDWEEYQADRDGLIDSAVRGYLRRYFPKDFEMMVKMFEPLDERHITVKRKYTENYPAVKVGKSARIRNKVLEAIKDGKLTKEEFDTILKEMTVDSTRWIKRNANYFNVSEDGITLSKTGKKILNELAPATDINEKATPFKIANARAEEIFGEFGVATLDYSQIARVIDVKLADKLAKKYGEDSFMALSELDMEELLNKNPKLVKENNKTNMKTQFIYESFGDFVGSINESVINEAFKSSMLASLFRTKGGKIDASLAKAFYGTAKIKMDLVEDEDILLVNPETAYKNKQADSIIFYVSDVPKENPYAPSDAWYDHKTIPGEGYLLAVASGENAFYTKSWGRYDRQYKLTKGTETDTIGISKKYKGWDGTGLYNVKRIAEVADRAIILNMSLLRQKYSAEGQRAERSAAQAGATAFKSDKDFKAENKNRYETILQNKASKLPLDKMVADAIDTLADQIKTGLAKGEKGKYGDLIIGVTSKGREAKMRDASNHMSNILDNYARYVDYVKQEEESVAKYGQGESWYAKSIKEYAKAIKDGISKIESFNYAW